MERQWRYRCPPSQSNYNQDDDEKGQGWKTIALAVAATALITTFYCIIDPRIPPFVIKKEKEKQHTTIEKKHHAPTQQQSGDDTVHDSTIPTTIIGRTTHRIKSYDTRKDQEDTAPPKKIEKNDSLVPVATHSPYTPRTDTDSLYE